MGKFIQEFKEFALKGNVMDMAVGIIIGWVPSVRSSLRWSMTSSCLLSVSSRATASLTLSTSCVRPNSMLLARLSKEDKLRLNWGNFVQTTVDFFIIAFCIFLMIKAMNSFRKKEEEQPEAPAATPEDIELLREIRDELKRRG